MQIDIDGSVIGMRYPTEVNIVGDAAATLQSLIPLLRAQADRVWRETVEKNVARWWEIIERQCDAVGRPGQPDADRLGALRTAARQRDRDRRLGVVDKLVRPLRAIPRRHARLAVGHAGHHGAAVPYAIGAKFAHPDRPVIALVGDGAMQMNGLAELLTIARYRDQWSDPRLVVCVFHNNDLNQVTWELRAMGGAPKFEESQSLPDVVVRRLRARDGTEAITVDNADEVGDAWERALRADRPTVLDVRCDPDVPPIPPHATYEQLKTWPPRCSRATPTPGI